MKKKLLFSACACMAVVLGLGCSEVNGVPSRAPSGYPEGPKTMVDAGATAITRTLYENLFVLAERGTMFGHQIPTLYGLDNNRKWWAGDDTDLSDTKYLTGSHPAVCGWELSNIELDMETNIDGELFTEVRKHIIAAFGRGAIRFRGIAPIPFRAETRGTGRAPSIRSFRAARTTKSSKAGSTRSPISC